jgi:DNA-binding MarR family transcriptional regulator
VSPGFLLWQAQAIWQRRQRAALTPLGLTHAQFVLLAGATWLTQNDPELTQARLAAHAKVDVMMTSQVLRTLETKGYVTRTPHERDSRAMVVGVTNAGAELASRAIVAVEDVDDRFFAALGQQEASFMAALRQLIAAATKP